MNIRATIDGEELEFEILNRGRTDDVTHYITFGGDIISIHGAIETDIQPLRVVRTEHRLGRVVFEETGERREPCNEWALGHLGFGPRYFEIPPGVQHQILREVRIDENPPSEHAQSCGLVHGVTTTCNCGLNRTPEGPPPWMMPCGLCETKLDMREHHLQLDVPDKVFQLFCSMECLHQWSNARLVHPLDGRLMYGIKPEYGTVS